MSIGTEMEGQEIIVEPFDREKHGKSESQISSHRVSGNSKPYWQQRTGGGEDWGRGKGRGSGFASGFNRYISYLVLYINC
jgi:hypothetical protein